MRWNLFKKKEINTVKKSVEENQGDVMGFDTVNITDVIGGANNGDDKNLIHIAVRAIANGVANVNYEIYQLDKEGNPEPVSQDNEVRKILENPSNVFNQKQFIYKWVGRYLFKGEVAIYYDKTNKKLHILDDIFPIWDKAGLDIVGYKNATGSVKYEIDEIFYKRVPEFLNGTGSAGVVEKVKDWIDLADENTRLMKRYSQSGTFLGGVLSVKTKKKEEIERITDQIQGAYSGIKNAFKLFVAPEGAKLEQFTGSAKDIEANATDERNTKKLLLALGVPPAILGDVDGKGRANVDGELYAFNAFTLLHLIKDFVDMVNSKIIPAISKKYEFMDFENPVKDDELNKAEIISKLTAGKQVISVNEARERYFKLAGVEGQDEINNDTNLFTMGLEKEIKKVNVPKKVKAKFLENKKVSKKIDSIVGKGVDDLVEILEEKYHNDFTKRVDKKGLAMLKIISSNAKDIKKEVLGKLSNLKSVKKEITETDLFDKEKQLENLNALSELIVADVVATEGAKQWKLIKNPKGAFNPDDPKLVKAVKAISFRRFDSYLGTTQKNLMETLNEGVSKGETTKELGERVEQVMAPRIAGKKAKTVAQDIVFTVANSTSKSAYEQSGVVSTIKWHTAEDEKVCPYCNGMNRKTVGVKESFFKKGDTYKVGGKELALDFENIEHPPIHSGCRCFVLPDQINI